jgi:hypothetical protein
VQIKEYANRAMKGITIMTKGMGAITKYSIKRFMMRADIAPIKLQTTHFMFLFISSETLEG